MNRKGLMPIWAAAVLGALFFLVGVYLAIAMFAVPIAFWAGIVLIIIGILMMFVAGVLS
jgi:hypothetical protein